MTAALFVAWCDITPSRAGAGRRAIAMSLVLVCSAAVAERARASEGPRSGATQAATIHWQQVPLSDAVIRLEKLFDASVFVDRRLNPAHRVTLQITASSIDDALVQLGAARGWSIARFGPLLYLGPNAVAESATATVAARSADVSRLPAAQRRSFEKKLPRTWPRLTEPRTLVVSLIETTGWSVANADRIPHDLWTAGRLPPLPLHEQLSVLLLGFDLTYKVRATDRVVEIVDLPPQSTAAPKPVRGAGTSPVAGPTPPQAAGTKQVYSLRVSEQPVGEVLRALGQRLGWQLKLDEAAIHAAGRSLDTRVSFAVENVDEVALLEAVLAPAGLTQRRDGQEITIVPR